MYLLLLKIKWVLQQADTQLESKKNFLRAHLRLFSSRKTLGKLRPWGAASPCPPTSPSLPSSHHQRLFLCTDPSCVVAGGLPVWNKAA